MLPLEVKKGILRVTSPSSGGFKSHPLHQYKQKVREFRLPKLTFFWFVFMLKLLFLKDLSAKHGIANIN
jgi:hypothetical protein